MSVKVTAPLKLIVTGEHSVVYGTEALVAALGEYTTVVVDKYTDSHQHITITVRGDREVRSFSEVATLGQQAREDWIRWNDAGMKGDAPDVSPRDGAFLIVEEFFFSFGVEYVPLAIAIDNVLPPGSGLGHSASFSAAIIYALVQYFKLEVENRQIEDAVENCERRFAGNPSGVDQAAVLHGGAFIFKKGDTNREYVSISESVLHDFHVVFTGSSASSTAHAVSHVRKLFMDEAYKKTMLQQFEEVIFSIKKSIHVGEKDALITAINANHALLSDLGLSSDVVDLFCDKIRSAGGACKVTGAGSVVGDSVGALLVFGIDRNELQQICFSHGYTLLSSDLSVKGVL